MATEILRPDAAGDYTNIEYQEPGSGSHWEKVDEASPDDATTCVYEDDTEGTKDAYNLEATAIPGGSTINSVKVYFRCWTEWPPVSVAQPFLRLGGSETAGTQILNEVSGDLWVTYSEILARPGGGSWAVADLNSLQVCILIGGGTAAHYVYCTQVYVEVDYTLVTFIPHVMIY